MNAGKIRRMLESRDLEEAPAPDEEVADFWNRAVRDSHVPGVSPEGALDHAYRVGLSAGTAILRAAGYG